MAFNNKKTIDVDGAANEDLVTNLQQYIIDCFNDAKEAKNAACISSEIELCYQQRNQHVPNIMGEDWEGSRHNPNITEVKCYGAESWIRDLLINSTEDMVSFDASENPELPPWEIEELASEIEQLMLNDPQVLQLTTTDVNGLSAIPSEVGGIDPAKLQKFIHTYISLIKEKKVERALRCAPKMQAAVREKLDDSNWRNVLLEVISDVITCPAGILKYGMQNKCVMKWFENSTVPRVTDSVELCFERVSPRLFYPSRDSTDCQDGSYVCEHKHLSRKDLIEMMDVSGFSKKNIKLVLEDYEYGNRGWIGCGPKDEEADDKTSSGWTRMSDTIDCIEFWGCVEGRWLKEFGMKDVDDYKMYHIECWVIGEHIIRCIRNPDPRGARPYRHCSFRKQPGRFWGKSLPQTVRWIHEVCYKMANYVATDAAFSSRPIGEVDIERLLADQVPDHFTPGQMYHVEGDGSGHEVFKFKTVSSNGERFINTFDYFHRLADEYSSVPSYSYGNASSLGPVRTATGLEILQGNAAKGLRTLINNIGLDIYEPVGQMVYDNIMRDPKEDETIKCDARPSIRNIEAIIDREVAASSANQTLLEIAPFVDLSGADAGVIKIDGARHLIRQILDARKYDTDKIAPDPSNPDNAEELRQLLLQIQGQPNEQLPTGQLPPAAGPPVI